MRILIVGAGIAGLAALRLLEKNYKVRLLERTPKAKFNTQGAGICLPAFTMPCLEKFNLKEQILDVAYRVSSLQFSNSQGKILTKSSLLEGELGKNPFVALPRQQLLDIFLKQLKDKIEFETWAEHFQEKTDQIEVVDNHGKTESFDLVLAADGISSPTRQQLFNNADPFDFGLQTWRFISYQQNHTMMPNYFVGADDLFMFFPLSKDTLYCYAHAVSLERSLTSLQTAFSNYHAHIRETLSKVGEKDLITGRICSVALGDVYKNRVLLIGDALHGCPPSMQSGVALALEDVLTLEHLLGKMKVAEALENFKIMRLSRIRWVVENSNRMMRLARLGRHRLGRQLRNCKLSRQGAPNVVAWRHLLEKKAFSLPS